MPELTTSESNEDLGFPRAADEGQDKEIRNDLGQSKDRPKGPRLTRLKVNLSSPLVVKTAGGENKAGPGDVVGHFGKHDVMMSKDLYIALLGQAKYDELVKKEMLKIRIAKRLDDGLSPFTEEEMGKQKAEIDEVLKNRPKPVAVDPNDLTARIQVTDSKNGPPTTKPDEYATIVPGPMLPIPEDIEDETDPPDVVAATGATSGTPGSFTPEGSTPPANLASLQSLTASPTEIWGPDEHVVLGDNSEAYWSGGAWVQGRAPLTGIDSMSARQEKERTGQVSGGQLAQVGSSKGEFEGQANEPADKEQKPENIDTGRPPATFPFNFGPKTGQ
jgi:hypothetical protein